MNDETTRGFEDVEETVANAPTLAFDTIFDEPSPSLEVPCVLDGGQRPEVKVVDRFTRGIAVVGRFALEPALLGLKVTPGDAPVRVRVQVSVDSTTDTWWHKRTPADTTRGPEATARMFLLRSQARTRAAIALGAPDMRPDGAVRAQVEFDLEPGAVHPDGLLILEAVQLSTLPDWAATRVMPYSPVGVRIDKVWLDEADSQDPAVVRPFVINNRGLGEEQLITLHPRADGSAGRVRVRRHYHRPSALVSRAGRKVVRESRTRLLRQADHAPPMDQVVADWIARGELAVRGVDLATGRATEVRLSAVTVDDHRDHGFVELTVPDPPEGPVLVGVRHTDPRAALRPELRRRLVTWEVTSDWR